MDIRGILDLRGANGPESFCLCPRGVSAHESNYVALYKVKHVDWQGNIFKLEILLKNLNRSTLINIIATMYFGNNLLLLGIFDISIVLTARVGVPTTK